MRAEHCRYVRFLEAATGRLPTEEGEVVELMAESAPPLFVETKKRQRRVLKTSAWACWCCGVSREILVDEGD